MNGLGDPSQGKVDVDGPGTGPRRLAKWHLADSFRKDIVERLGEVSLKLDTARKPEIMRTRAVQKRIAAFQTQRLLASEPSMGMRNLSAQVSLSGTLKSYQLPSMQTLPELPSIARPRRNAREVVIDRVENRRKYHIQLDYATRALVERSVAEFRDILMEEACQLFSSKLTRYRGLGLSVRTARDRVQRIAENDLIRRVAIEVSRYRDTLLTEEALRAEARERIDKELEELNARPSNPGGDAAVPVPPRLPLHRQQSSVSGARSSRQINPNREGGNGRRTGQAAGSVGSMRRGVRFPADESEDMSAVGGRGLGGGPGSMGGSAWNVEDPAVETIEEDDEGLGQLEEEVEVLLDMWGEQCTHEAQPLLGTLAYQRDFRRHRLDLQAPEPVVKIYEAPSVADGTSDGAQGHSGRRESAVEKQDKRSPKKVQRIDVVQGPPEQVLREDRGYFFLPAVRNFLIPKPTKIRSATSGTLSEFASKVHGTLQRVGTSKTSTSTRADKIGESIRQFVIGMRKHTVDLFSLSTTQWLSLDGCDLGTAMMRGVHVLKNFGTCLRNMASCKGLVTIQKTARMPYLTLRKNYMRHRQIADLLATIHASSVNNWRLSAVDLSGNDLGELQSVHASGGHSQRRIMHQPSRDVFLEAISAPGRPPSGDSVQSLPHRQYSSRMLHLKQIRKEARRVAQRMLEKHSSFKTDLALGGLATSEVLPTDMRMGTINERDLRALTGHAKQFRGELDLGDFAWVDTVHVNLTKKDLPRGVARSAMAREGGATPLVGDINGEPAPGIAALCAFLLKEASAFRGAAAPGDHFVNWIGVGEDGDVQFVGVKGLEDGGWLTVADEDNARFQFPDIIGHCDVLDELEQSMFPMSEKGEVDPETGYWHPDVSAGVVEVPAGRISQLILQNNMIRDVASLAMLGATVMNCRGLRELCLSHNEIGPDGMAALCMGLRLTPHLRALDLSFNELDEDAAAELANVMPSMAGLQALDLSWNRLGDNGVSVIAEAVPDTPALKELHLCSTGCGDAAALELARSLDPDSEKGSVLELLSIAGNMLSRTSLDALKVIAEAREKELSIIAHGLQGTVFIDEDGNPAPDPTIPSPAVVAANAEAMLTAKAEAHKEVINFMEDEPEPEAGEEP